MGGIEQFIVKVKRAETPFYATVKRAAKRLLVLHAPVPRFAFPLFRGAEYCKALACETARRLLVAIYRYPVLRSRCEEIGLGLDMELIPAMSGPVKIWLGNNVRLSGRISIAGARVFDHPKLVVHDRVFIGSGVCFSIAREVIVEDDVLIAGECIISDYSGHPVDPEQRLTGIQVPQEEVRPVRICRNAWIGRRAIILPGVTIGEGAIVGAGTVVTKDVPAFHLCVGNPGRNIERKKAAAASST